MDEPSDLMNASESMATHDSDPSGRKNINVSRLRAIHMGPVGIGGPKTADESNKLENMPIGILGSEQKLVKYSNPCLLGYLFPTLYPEGRGYFSLDYEGIDIDQNQEIQLFDGKPYSLPSKFVDHTSLDIDRASYPHVLEEVANKLLDDDDAANEESDGYISWSDSDEEGFEESSDSEGKHLSLPEWKLK
ncbi:hypothetical protein BGZ49_009157 [Haplosporangium sp. Z 27]|nr:hypothetical protein BGZ49_009157 [Haplosporangium sp. Z 27]